MDRLETILQKSNEYHLVWFTLNINEVLKTKKFEDIDKDLAHEFFETFHKFSNSLEGEEKIRQTLNKIQNLLI